LGEQALLDAIALIQAERNGERPIAAELFELIDAVFENVHRLQARLQIVVALLNANHVVEIGLHVCDELLIADRGPRPAAERQCQYSDEREERAVTQPCLGWASELSHGLAIGEDHLREQIAQEKAVLRGGRLRRGKIVGREAKARADAKRRGAVRLPLLQCAREIKAA